MFFEIRTCPDPAPSRVAVFMHALQRGRELGQADEELFVYGKASGAEQFKAILCLSESRGNQEKQDCQRGAEASESFHFYSPFHKECGLMGGC
jgi:hypothetical protein